MKYIGKIWSAKAKGILKAATMLGFALPAIIFLLDFVQVRSVKVFGFWKIYVASGILTFFTALVVIPLLLYLDKRFPELKRRRRK